MPLKSKRPCRYPGCKALTTSRYCEEHAQLEPKYERPKELRERYGSAWRKIRNRYIAKHPLCAHCLRDGRYTAATEVDHIVPLSHGGKHAESNLQALCKSCHSKKTMQDGDRFKKKVYSYDR